MICVCPNGQMSNIWANISVDFSSIQTNKAQFTRIFKEGKRQFIRKNYYEAIESFEKALKLNSANKLVREYIRLCQDSISWMEKEERMILNINKAEEIQRRLSRLDEWNETGILLIQQEEYNLAITEFDKVLEFDPQNIIALRYKDKLDIIKKKIEEKQLKRIEEEIKIQAMVQEEKVEEKLFFMPV